MNNTEDIFDEWEKSFKPIQNHINSDRGWNGLMFETYGDDLQFVISQPQNKVWTWVDGEEGTYLLNGYHLVNRIGYFVTEKSWSADHEITVDKYSEEQSTNDGDELIAITNLSTDEVDNPITQGGNMPVSTNTDWHLKDGVLTFVDTGEQWDVSHWGDGVKAESSFQVFKSLSSEAQLVLLEKFTEITEGDIQ